MVPAGAGAMVVVELEEEVMGVEGLGSVAVVGRTAALVE